MLRSKNLRALPLIFFGFSCCSEFTRGANPRFLENWSAATQYNAKSVAFGNGTFVSVGDQSPFDQSTTIYTSTNGLVWTNAQPGGKHSLYSVCHGKGKFVAVGFEIAGISENGSTWTFQIQTQSFIKVIAAGNEYAAVTAQGRAGFSADGLNWHFHPASAIRPEPVSSFMEGIAYANNTYVVGGKDRLCVSTNKMDWEEFFFPERSFFEVTHGKGLFVAAATEGSYLIDVHGTGRTTATNQIWISKNGREWTKTHQVYGDIIQTVAYGNGVFIAAGSREHFLLSTDGFNWQTHRAPFSTFKLSFAADRFFAAGYPTLSISPEVMSLEATLNALRIYGPIGKAIQLHSIHSPELVPMNATEIVLTESPMTVDRPAQGYIIGSLQSETNPMPPPDPNLDYLHDPPVVGPPGEEPGPGPNIVTGALPAPALLSLITVTTGPGGGIGAGTVYTVTFTGGTSGTFSSVNQHGDSMGSGNYVYTPNANDATLTMTYPDYNNDRDDMILVFTQQAGSGQPNPFTGTQVVSGDTYPFIGTFTY